MRFKRLPQKVIDLLESVEALPALIKHLTLVHDSATQVISALDTAWPELSYDRQAVLIGAAIHDIGKIGFPQELLESGNRHENAGESILLRNGIERKYARFTSTHNQWQLYEMIGLEDLLVALADKIWKGEREKNLEIRIARAISAQTGMEIWQIYMQLDDFISDISKDADKRLNWAAE